MSKSYQITYHSEGSSTDNDYILFKLSNITCLKVVSATFLLDCFLSLNENTCQTRKNAFYLTSKALFVLEKIKF